MNSFKIAFKLLRNNIQIYEFYLIVLVVTIATYYNFAAIQYNAKFVEMTERMQSASVASLTSGFVLLCTVVFFMWHANGFFFKQRQKETGLYMLMGISSSKIGKVFAIESMLLGGMGILAGLTVGILFSKLFFLFLGKATALKEDLPFMVAQEAIIQIVLVFGFIFLLLGFYNYTVTKKSQLIHMMNAVNQKPTVPKLNYPKGIFGVLLILTGYVVASNFVAREFDLLITSMSTLVLVSYGTYMFFGSFLTIIFNKLLKSKVFIYKGIRLISLSNLFFRLKTNYRSLAMTAILVAATVTAFSVSLSFKKFASDHVIMEAPYSISYESPDKATLDKVISTIKLTKHQLLGVNETAFIVANIEYVKKAKKVDIHHEGMVTSFSQIRKTLEFLDYKNRESMLKKIEPKENEVAFLLNANTIASPINVKGEEIVLSGKQLHIKENTQVPFTGNVAPYGKRNVYILNDTTYEQVKAGILEVNWVGLSVTGQEESAELVANLASLFPNGSTKVHGYIKQYIWEYYALGIFFFLGLIMSIVFMLSTFSTIYFKILSDALMDREQYSILKKIGMSKKEIRKSVNLQVGISFLLPVIVGIIHSVVAMSMLEDIMNVTFHLQIVLGISLFVAVMMAFYVGISANYTNLVYNESH